MSHLMKYWEELDTLFEKKNQDYANDTEKYKNFKYNAMIWGTKDWEQMLYRASEKMIRIANLKGKEANFEGIEDSMRDIIVLTTMALDSYKEVI